MLNLTELLCESELPIQERVRKAEEYLSTSNMKAFVVIHPKNASDSIKNSTQEIDPTLIEVRISYQKKAQPFRNTVSEGFQNALIGDDQRGFVPLAAIHSSDKSQSFSRYNAASVAFTTVLGFILIRNGFGFLQSFICMCVLLHFILWLYHSRRRY